MYIGYIYPLSPALKKKKKAANPDLSCNFFPDSHFSCINKIGIRKNLNVGLLFSLRRKKKKDCCIACSVQYWLQSVLKLFLNTVK